MDLKGRNGYGARKNDVGQGSDCTSRCPLLNDLVANNDGKNCRLDLNVRIHWNQAFTFFGCVGKDRHSESVSCLMMSLSSLR